MAFEPRSQQVADLPIRFTKLPHWDVELDIDVGLRAQRGAHLVDENALVLADADLVVRGRIRAVEAEQVVPEIADALEAGGDVGTLEAAAQVVHVLDLGERVGRGAEVDLEAQPGRVGHAVVGQQPDLRRVLLPRERRQVRLDGRQRTVVRRPI